MKQEPEKVTTKICPKCGNTKLIHLPSQNRKLCSDCNPITSIPWYLEQGQKPIL